MGYADTLFDLTDRVVLITGGSRGLGREMAFAMAECGADVIIASRNYESCVATAEQITAATGRAAPRSTSTRTSTVHREVTADNAASSPRSVSTAS